MRTTTTYIQDNRFESVNEAGHRLEINIGPAEQRNHQSPTELLLSALSACAAVDLVQMLKKRRKTVAGLSVVADGRRRDEHPRAFTHIELTFTLKSPDATQSELGKLGRLAATKYCSVAATLNAQVEHRFELLR